MSRLSRRAFLSGGATFVSVAGLGLAAHAQGDATGFMAASSSMGKAITEAVPDWKQASIWFCGPTGFGRALRSQFLAAGLSHCDWHQELFEMR